MWIYNSQAIVGQGVGEDNNSHLVTKLSLNWTGPYKILVVGPGLGPEGRPAAEKTLYLDLPTDMPQGDQKKRVSVNRCKMCHNPSDDSDTPKYLPAELSKYVLHSFTDKSQPFHPTTEDVVKSGICQLNRENRYFPVCSRSRLRVWSRETRSAVRSRASLLILQTQAESGAYSRNSSRLHGIPSDLRGGVLCAF